MLFEYFHFMPLEYQDAATIKGVDGYLYSEWGDEFARNGRIFYQAQLEAHERHIQMAFRQEVNVSGDVWDHPGYSSFLTSMGYDHHREAMEKHLHSIPPGSASASEIADEVKHWFESRAFEYMPKLWALWFQQETTVSADEQARVKRMEYPRYLRSTYWRRVRAAMLMLTRLRCESVRCFHADNFHGWEDLLHIHHLHYQNRGREQRDNLVVLCDRCHKRVHAGEAVIAPITDEA